MVVFIGERFSKKKYETPYENFIKLIWKIPFVVILRVLEYLDPLNEAVIQIDEKKQRVMERVLNKDYFVIIDTLNLNNGYLIPTGCLSMSF